MTVINHDKKFIFVHVPRTGGHSAYEVLGGQSAGAMHAHRKDIKFDYYSFGFIRNPWDRMYSVYRRQRVMPKHQGSGFKRYLLEGIKDNGIRFSALTFLDGCDFIGRYENLQADWNRIFDTIGMQPKELPHLNKYGDAGYRQHYDNELIDYIALNHKDDIEYGGYTF